MAKKCQKVYYLAPTNGHLRGTIESTNLDAKELKRKKRVKLVIYVVIFAVFQIVVIMMFRLVVMRTKAPKLGLSNKFVFQTLKTNITRLSPSFDMSFATQVRIKNTNWGPYKFENTTANFTYNDEIVGHVVIPKGKAGLRSTKKVHLNVSSSSSQFRNTSNLGSELGVGTLTLRSMAKMRGKAELMSIIKKKKSSNMDCTITIDVPQKVVWTLEC